MGKTKLRDGVTPADNTITHVTQKGIGL
jgi:hypothetical protein